MTTRKQPMTNAKPRSRKTINPTGLTEAHVEQTITQFLELDGWRSFKMEANSERGFASRVMARVRSHSVLSKMSMLIHAALLGCMRGHGVGEPGMPDRLYVRYFTGTPIVDDRWTKADVEALWIEFKKPGEKPRPDQIAWHEAERRRGALILVVSDIDDFMKRWYPESGLQRKR